MAMGCSISRGLDLAGSKYEVMEISAIREVLRL